MRPTIQHCALTGVRLDDGHPLHRSRFRRGRFVCLAVAHVLDAKGHHEDLPRFIATLLQREKTEAEASRWAR